MPPASVNASDAAVNAIMLSRCRCRTLTVRRCRRVLRGRHPRRRPGSLRVPQRPPGIAPPALSGRVPAFRGSPGQRGQCCQHIPAVRGRVGQVLGAARDGDRAFDRDAGAAAQQLGDLFHRLAHAVRGVRLHLVHHVDQRAGLLRLGYEVGVGLAAGLAPVARMLEASLLVRLHVLGDDLLLSGACPQPSTGQGGRSGTERSHCRSEHRGHACIHEPSLADSTALRQADAGDERTFRRSSRLSPGRGCVPTGARSSPSAGAGRNTSEGRTRVSPAPPCGGRG